MLPRQPQPGLPDAIDRYIEALPHRDELPEALLRIVGIEAGRGTARRTTESRRTTSCSSPTPTASSAA